MRLTKEQRDTLKASVRKIDEKAEIFLFGSRVDDNLKGGDIDLLIHSDRFDRRAIRKVRIDFYARFGEQKIDILIDRGQDDPFLRLIRDKAVPL